MTSSDATTDAILFVEDYNIFYIPDVGVSEKKVYPVSQTEVVVPEVVFHGIPNWVYEGSLLYYSHHAEGLVNPKVRAKKFGY
jgi:hypothetical protein